MNLEGLDMKRFAMVVTMVFLILLLSAPARAVDMKLAGKSALLMDVQTGTVLYESNAHEKLAPASVTKVMTMLLIMEAVDSGKITMEDMVTASETAAAKGGSQIYLKAGETMTVSDMLKSIAVSSANDCACAMAEHLAGSEQAFVEKMNQRAGELGMEDTTFVNCTGLDDGENAGEHKTSAHDIALMSRELLKNHPNIKEFTTIWMAREGQAEAGWPVQYQQAGALLPRGHRLENRLYFRGGLLLVGYRPAGGDGTDRCGDGGRHQHQPEYRLQAAAGLRLCQFCSGEPGAFRGGAGGGEAGESRQRIRDFGRKRGFAGG